MHTMANIRCLAASQLAIQCLVWHMSAAEALLVCELALHLMQESAPQKTDTGSSATTSSSSQAAQVGASAAGAGAAAPCRTRPITAQERAQSEQSDRIAHAHLMLGYLHLDGEGTRRDNGAAVTHMRAAAGRGNAEAQKTLGWMYNTGQFGK